MRIIAHGGAGSPPEQPPERQQRIENAIDAGLAQETPLEAVCETITALEADPWFNAGVGSAVQTDGAVRTDAGLMTDDRECGAVAGLEGVANAIDVARAVLEETPHVMLAGEPAIDFAGANGVETDVDCWADRTRERWNETTPPGDAVAEQLDWLAENFGGNDTVGAVATDGDRIVTGTSTGGRWAALAGRVGDVPQVGAGFYATKAGGASATGAGEDIAKEALARRAVRCLEDGDSPERAATRAIDRFDDRVEGTAGVIVLDRDGSAGSAYNSAAMQTARGER
ncbi:isoaspartyl peptidase/L-asparaginase [Halorhabdus sp. CUG00001]|uniref:isoaspartyl peptidase/L-asparaginase n=1 Tax=Halorhabdus sp. CUG00001 TaxID=2600297 RepID=UPI00131CE8F6|nr:isoaspartyl peptidase/L-asparaginase [Halorhabdus sp. CUG00001]